MYPWLVFIHIVGVAGFLLAHGVSVSVALKLRKERDRARIRTLLELSGSSIKLFYVSLVLLLVGGVWASIVGRWWGQMWITASLIILIATLVLMLALAAPYYRRISRAAQIRPTGTPAASDEELVFLLSSGRAILVAAIGFIGLLAILYLMVFKPI